MTSRRLAVSLALGAFAACSAKQVAPTPSEPPDASASAPAADAGASDAGASDAGAAAGAVDAGPPPPPSKIVATPVWVAALPGVGTGSPRLTDLNGDGVLDVVLVGGLEGTFGAVYAVDGKTGKQLWKYGFKEDLYATPALVDLNKDGVADVVVGGRDFDGTAINGKTGKWLWSLRRKNPKQVIPARNFNGATVVPDQDGDGVVDLAFTQGGHYDDTKRLPGRLFIVSGATGVILHNVPMPDGREIYSLPVVVPGSAPLELVFGSGGETLDGHLYRFQLPNKVLWALPSTKKGFIASPVMYDFEGQGALDVVESSFQGSLMRIDGATGAVKWEVPHEGHEAYASPGFGQFGGDGTLDVVASFMRGTYPSYKFENVITWVDGKTGAVIDEAKLGVFTSASPVTADVDGDGYDETFVIAMDSFEIWGGTVHSTLAVYDGRPGRVQRLAILLNGAGASTPYVADLDHDGKLDVVFAYFGKLERHSLEVPDAGTPALRWPGFRGEHFDGVLDRQDAGVP